ncbi:MAG: redox-sensing transcriptional repressor Rex [Rikenellaceae bacterium]|nr:redox-sensing transcriptional repressor Rex [Rikenellaceae bacterium]MDE7355571.1 redox-sensing transcriptional repressor Rex [Rikenellaceae bacterium]
MTKKILPEKTIERLSEYRRTLLRKLSEGVTHIHSHSLASVHGITAVQVRRDLMLIGFSSDNKKGYNVSELIDFISSILDSENVAGVAVIGMGKLATAITSYFNGKRSKMRIVAAFDNDPSKIGANIASIPVYPMESFSTECARLGIRIALLTLPAKALDTIGAMIDQSPIRGVLNFTSKPFTPAEGSQIYVEDYDIITLLEKVAYFTKDDNLP